MRETANGGGQIRFAMGVNMEGIIDYLTQEEQRSAARMNQLNSQMQDLCADLDRLQAKALPLLEEVENFALENNCPGVKMPKNENFRTLHRLILKV